MLKSASYQRQKFVTLVTRYLTKEFSQTRRQLLPFRTLVWDCAKDSAFKDTKMLTAFAGTLAYLDTNKSVAMEVDASKHDLGAVLLQIANLFDMRRNC